MLRLIALVALTSVALGIPVDNGLEGEPEVQCGPSTIQVSFASRNDFQGLVYAKGHSDDAACAVVGDGRSGGSLELDFDGCNTRRSRSLEPRGVFVSVTVVVQFHPSVLTKVDRPTWTKMEDGYPEPKIRLMCRAFHVRCFYMEADKTVDAELEVSMVTTDLVTLTVPMPVCRYDILDGGPDGAPVSFVTIGQKVYHKWTCDSETLDTFCMEVYGCTVDDGVGTQGSTLELLDFDGCAVDRNLLDNIDYSPPNGDLMGGQETHVFKYADRPQLYFNCQIRIGVKEPGSDCQAWREQGTGPCPAPFETLGRRKRAARSKRFLLFIASQNNFIKLGFLDITPQRALFVADVELTQADLPAGLRSQKTPPQGRPELVCTAQGYAGLLVGLVAILGLVAIALTLVLFCRR